MEREEKQGDGEKEPMVEVTFKVAKKDWERLESIAKMKGVSPADIVQEALRREIWIDETIFGGE